MKRTEFSRKTKLTTWENAGGCCESCGKKLFPGDGAHYDHIVACEHGGGNEPSNCQLLCRACHAPKTREDIAITAKGRKIRARHAGAKTPRHKLQGSKGSGIRKRMDGSVWRE